MKLRRPADGGNITTDIDTSYITAASGRGLTYIAPVVSAASVRISKLLTHVNKQVTLLLCVRRAINVAFPAGRRHLHKPSPSQPCFVRLVHETAFWVKI